MPTERQQDQQFIETERRENLARANRSDPYATLRAAFHAGATIQAYTVEGDDGQKPLVEVEGRGYWRDLVRLDGERPMPKFSCHPTRYRVKPEGA